jgi:hypothetical protein
MLQPPGCVEPGKEHMVCKLQRSLYGLRQSPRAWYSRIDSYLQHRGLERTAADPNVYFYRRTNILVFLVLYVDDLMLTGSDPVFIADLTRDLRREFEMKDLGLMQKFLGVQVRQTTHGIFLHQSDYATSIIQRFLTPLDRPSHIPLSPTLQLRKNTKTPLTNEPEYLALVGQLHYLTKTRPDISYATSLASRFMHGPQHAHRTAAQNIVRYLAQNPTLGLWYPKGEEDHLVGFSDADYGGSLDDRISTSAYLFIFGRTPISWCSRK